MVNDMSTNKKSRKEKRKQNKSLETDFHITRLVMKVVSIFCLVLGGLLPFTYWGSINPTPDNPMTKDQSITFIVFVVAAISNVTLGIMTFLWSLNWTDEVTK